jgi:hypothetical protein
VTRSERRVAAAFAWIVFALWLVWRAVQGNL